MIRRAARLAAGLALPALLGGCIAVAALPLAAGSAMFAGGHVKIKAATKRPKSVPVLATRTDAGYAASVPVALAAGAGVTLTSLTALPMPDAVRDAADPWKRFVAWSLDHTARFGEGAQARSMLYDAGSSLALPQMQGCRAKAPAVLIDLDPDKGVFAPAAGLAPPPGLTEGLAKLREAGAAVVWITALPAARVGEVAEALRQSGLDPEGKDPLLLDRNGTDRKQALRQDAAADVCVIAIAGDRKDDFDELFDYLRDPADAQAFDSYFGAGWFLAPPPLG